MKLWSVMSEYPQIKILPCAKQPGNTESAHSLFMCSYQSVKASEVKLSIKIKAKITFITDRRVM